MYAKILLGGLAAAALTVSGAAAAGNPGKGQGKGNSSAAHGKKAQRGHSASNQAGRDWAATGQDTRNAGRCPPGLAKKNNGCMAPGQAKKRFAQGDRLPATFRTNNVPAAYADQYRDTAASLYRYNSGDVYRIDRVTQRIAEVIKLPTL
ncbi:MAG TPA: hypothetical protein VF637_05480 [Sphingomicrobium sp.]